MALQDTNLLIQGSQIPPTFKGTPQQFFEAMLKRMKIVSPTGTNFIFIGDTEPTSNVGPWLRNGNQWWVFDPDLKRYVPLDISASETAWYHIGATTPDDSVPPVWLRTTKDPTTSDPSVGVPIGWYLFNGSTWESFVGIVPSGPTASRPGGPQAFQQFYDSTISALIWFERGAWRTISGVPGDVKYVAFETLTEALSQNPGWEVLGASNQAFRGRILTQATKDSGATPATDLTVGSGVTKRGAFEIFGGDVGVEVDFIEQSVTVNNATNEITLAAHGFVLNQQVKFTGTTAPAPLIFGTTYYVRDVTLNTFTVASDPNGAAVDITTNGSAVKVKTFNPSPTLFFPAQMALWTLVKL